MRTWTWGMCGAALVAGLAWAPGAARAEACGNIGETGVCQDPKTLLYCARGELETMTCAADEICVPHEFYGGSSGCVATRYAGCGDITAAGQCLGGALLLYCENNRVAERVCADGWTCGLVEGDGDPYFDCVAALDVAGSEAEAEPTPPAESEIEDEDDHVEQDPVTTYPDAIAGPSVERGGAAAAGEYAASGDGACAGGGEGGSLVGLALAALATRRRTARRPI